MLIFYMFNFRIFAVFDETAVVKKQILKPYRIIPTSKCGAHRFQGGWMGWCITAPTLILDTN